MPTPPDVFAAVAVTGPATYKSAPTCLGERAHDVWWTVSTTGTPVGAVTVEITADGKDAVDAGTATWVPYTAFTPSGTLSISGAMTDYIDAQELNGAHARLSAAIASGTGTISAFVKAKRH